MSTNEATPRAAGDVEPRCPYRHPSDDGLCALGVGHTSDHWYRDAFQREYQWPRDLRRDVLGPIAELREHCLTRASRTMPPKQGAWQRRAAALDTLVKLAAPAERAGEPHTCENEPDWCGDCPLCTDRAVREEAAVHPDTELLHRLEMLLNRMEWTGAQSKNGLAVNGFLHGVSINFEGDDDEATTLLGTELRRFVADGRRALAPAPTEPPATETVTAKGATGDITGYRGSTEHD